jgi:hypothetical protein
MLKNSLKFHCWTLEFSKRFFCNFFPNLFGLQIILNNFLDFINNSEKETFIRIPCSPRLLARKPISSFPFHSAQPTRLGVISYLASKLSLSSTTRRRLVEPPWLSRLPRAPSLYGRPLPLLNLGYNHNLQPLFPPPFNSRRRPLPSSPPRCSFPRPYK